MILFFDTTADRYCIALCSPAGRILRRKTLMRGERIGDSVFRAIRSLLKTRKPQGIVVVVGPGRFSGIRHGITIANALSFAWNIPVVGVEKDSDNISSIVKRGLCMLKKPQSRFVVPSYGKEPNITLSGETFAKLLLLPERSRRP